MAKQPCFYDRKNIDALFKSLFAVSDSCLMDASLAGLIESRSTDSDQTDFIQRAIHVGSVILEAGKRFDRKRSSVHNASVWPLPPELTVKVFSMLDTRSVCFSAATCLFFQKCSTDPLCYASIDLALIPKIIPPKINNALVSTMIERAGNTLWSIKLGLPLPRDSSDDDDDNDDECGDEPYGQRKESLVLTLSCLSSLSANGGALGSRLRRLHLYNIEISNNAYEDIALTEALSSTLSVCPSLVELKIVNMDVCISRILKYVSRYCHLLECLVSYAGTNYTVESSVCKEFVVNCPKITTLALNGFELPDSVALELVKGFNELKYVDFAGCHSLTRAFLETLATKGDGNSLEVMVFRQCFYLHQVEVKYFMNALLEGKFRRLRHLDISNIECLAYRRINFDRRFDASFILIKELLKQRPNFCLVAEILSENMEYPTLGTLGRI